MNRVAKWMVVWFPLLLLFLLFGCLDQIIAQPLFNSAWDPLAGSRVFGDKGCGKCHAISGVGGQAGPDLARIPGGRSFYDLAAAIWNHLPSMTAKMQQLGIFYPRLSPQETGDLIAFLYTIDYFDPPGNVVAGRRLFSEKKCVLCHQVDGTGGVVGPDLDFLKQYGSPIFVAAVMWNHSPAMSEALQAKGIGLPTFKDAELLDLIAYLKSVSESPSEGPFYVLPGRAEEGRRLFESKRCIECHSIGEQGAQGLPEGGDLAKRELPNGLTQFAAMMWNKIPAMLEAMRVRGISVPQLQAQEMADLVAYLYSIRYFAGSGTARKGQELVADKGCLECHAISGKGGKHAPDFARLQGLDSPTMVMSTLWNHAFLMEAIMQAQEVAWPHFSSEEMADLMVFLQTVGGPR
jgi:mono/diheme cytochrome c family protein